MLNIDSLENGLVIDHIAAGKGMSIYKFLKLDKLDCSIAVIKNAKSKKLGRKDIIKIDGKVDVDIDVLGFIDPNITVNIIKGSKIAIKKTLTLPKTIVNVLKCKNPRCITSTERGLHHIFELTDTVSGTYRCIYCEQEYTV